MELPAAFTDYMCALLGKETYERLAGALEGEQPVSIRLNKEKVGEGALNAFRTAFRAVPWTEQGFYLPYRPTFTFDPLFHAGCYYVQEASSMFVEQALRQHAGHEALKMLDLCAAPGGKSTHARSVLPAGSLLVANEVIRNRSQILAENLTKWGEPGVVVTNNDPADFAPLEGFFDVILTDVPCSGEGMFRKDPVAVSEWSTENVEVCWQRQRRILSDVWPALASGGLLIYSTCTYNTKENEENVRWISRELGAEVLPVNVPAEWGITGNLLSDEEFPVYRFLPHATEGEGLFLAVLRKRGEADARFSMSAPTETGLVSAASVSTRAKARKPQGKGAKGGEIAKEQLAALRTWLLSSEEYELLAEGSRVDAFPRRYLSELAALRSSLRILQAGVAVAELKGKDWIPEHALALSTALNPAAFVREEVSYEQAIAYLRKEAVTLSQAVPRGIVLLTYRRIPLGFVKNIGNRANNLYPQEWRIRSGYLPDEVRLLPIADNE